MNRLIVLGGVLVLAAVAYAHAIGKGHRDGVGSQTSREEGPKGSPEDLKKDPEGFRVAARNPREKVPEDQEDPEDDGSQDPSKPDSPSDNANNLPDDPPPSPADPLAPKDPPNPADPEEPPPKSPEDPVDPPKTGQQQTTDEDYDDRTLRTYPDDEDDPTTATPTQEDEFETLADECHDQYVRCWNESRPDDDFGEEVFDPYKITEKNFQKFCDHAFPPIVRCMAVELTHVARVVNESDFFLRLMQNCSGEIAKAPVESMLKEVSKEVHDFYLTIKHICQSKDQSKFHTCFHSQIRYCVHERDEEYCDHVCNPDDNIFLKDPPKGSSKQLLMPQQLVQAALLIQLALYAAWKN